MAKRSGWTTNWGVPLPPKGPVRFVAGERPTTEGHHNVKAGGAARLPGGVCGTLSELNQALINVCWDRPRRNDRVPGQRRTGQDRGVAGACPSLAVLRRNSFPGQSDLQGMDRVGGSSRILEPDAALLKGHFDRDVWMIGLITAGHDWRRSAVTAMAIWPFAPPLTLGRPRFAPSPFSKQLPGLQRGCSGATAAIGTGCSCGELQLGPFACTRVPASLHRPA